MNTSTTLCKYSAGKILIHENDKSRKMYIIKEGRVKVYKTYMGQKITLAVLGPGEIFGELSFFDAEPRTATVEVLSDLSVVVVDGNSEIEGLPNWVMPIFKTIVHRLREADQKITQLQSMYEFQKRSQKIDKLAQTIYIEVLRFIKSLKVLYSEKHKDEGEIKESNFYKEFSDLLGTCNISVKDFWDGLLKHNFIDGSAELENKLIIDVQRLENFNKYVQNEIENETYLILSHTSIAILNNILSYQKEYSSEVELSFSKIHIDKIPLAKEGIKELSECGIFSTDSETIVVSSQDVINLYIYQSIIKSFDHTNIYRE